MLILYSPAEVKDGLVIVMLTIIGTTPREVSECIFWVYYNGLTIFIDSLSIVSLLKTLVAKGYVVLPRYSDGDNNIQMKNLHNN